MDHATRFGQGQILHLHTSAQPALLVGDVDFAQAAGLAAAQPRERFACAHVGAVGNDARVHQVSRGVRRKGHEFAYFPGDLGIERGEVARAGVGIEPVEQCGAR